MERGDIHRNSENLVPQLTEVLNNRGIKAVLMDMDDTLVDTSYLFISRMQRFANFVGTNSNITADRAFKVMRETIGGLRDIYKVDPTLLYIAGKMAAQTGNVDFNSKGYREAYEHLTDVYHLSPPVFEGVHDALEIFKGTGMRLGLVTHASVEWTNIKLTRSGLGDFFDMVYCIDTLHEKNAQEWRNALRIAGVSSQEVIVVGDSWTSDIAPAVSLGVPHDHIYRVKTDYGHANKNAIDGVREINGVVMLPYQIIEILKPLRTTNIS